jgi:integrase
MEIHEAKQTDRLDRLLAEVITLHEAIEIFLRVKAPDITEATLGRYRTSLGHFSAFCGPALVHDVLVSETVAEFKAARLAAGQARGTVRFELAAVSLLASEAIGRGWISERPKIKRPKTPKRINYYEPDQLALYMAHLPPKYRLQVEVMFRTGMRLGEVESLTVNRLRFRRHSDGRIRGARVLLDDSKTEEGVRRVFVPRSVARLMYARITESGLTGHDRLFTSHRRALHHAHSKAVANAGLPHHTLHDFRHTAAVLLAREGMPIPLIQRQLGHKRIETTMVYAEFHPAYGDVERYFDKVDSHLGGDNRGGSVDVAVSQDA